MPSAEIYEVQEFELGEVQSLQALHFAPFQPPKPRFLSIPIFFPRYTDTEFLLAGVPVIESVLSDHFDIPISNTIVTLRFQRKNYTFRLAYRYSEIFLRNRALKTIYSGVDWHGDLVVMKMGILDTYVHLGSGTERKAAQRAVKHFLQQAGPYIEQAALTNRQIIEFPSNIHVV